ncbi:hypothetical protein [Pseudomonas savastanoi]|uniref:hypothetical protein n=1 Tax=Pseudomonas savastanoi TaxID=29438 RepID=UPI00155DB696|nr:hypothetical protein [Pseudomonas savastanoi]MCQ3006517.1 hypothetical protein [Pseudomonas savastanoi]
MRNVEWNISGILSDDDYFLTIGMSNAHLVEDVGILAGAITNYYGSFINKSNNILNNRRVIPSVVSATTLHFICCSGSLNRLPDLGESSKRHHR